MHLLSGTTGSCWSRRPCWSDFAALCKRKHNGPQTIESGAAVPFGPAGVQITVSGIGYDGVDMFTIINPGLYYLDCTLSFGGAPAGSSFAIELNNALVAPACNTGIDGQISVIRVAMLPAGTTIHIVNQSDNAVILQPGNSSSMSDAGHFCFFRFADGPLADNLVFDAPGA